MPPIGIDLRERGDATDADTLDPAVGTVTFGPKGEFVFTPAPGYSGFASFDYSFRDPRTGKTNPPGGGRRLETGRARERWGSLDDARALAFVLAGAETAVMSLWKVSDDATQRLMVDYYGRLLAGSGRSAALRDVQQRFGMIPNLAGAIEALPELDASDAELILVGDEKAIRPLLAKRRYRALAVALEAEKLVILTDVEGIFADWPDRSSFLSQLDASGARRLLERVDAGIVAQASEFAASILAGATGLDGLGVANPLGRWRAAGVALVGLVAGLGGLFGLVVGVAGLVEHSA